MNKLICIAGPTASGKTALSIGLAKFLGGEVISCDSMQIYKYMDIGTAKPTQEEMGEIPHHMLDIAEPHEDFSVSRYCSLATPIIENLLGQDRYTIVAGGTGLYMDSLVRGNTFAPFPSTGMRQKLEQDADALGMENIWQQLNKIDPDSASRLHLKDRKRILRALEVYYETGKTITQHNLETKAIPSRFHPIWFGLEDINRTDLYERIDARVLKMIEDGLLQEIEQLLARGVPPKCTAMQAIGYKEFLGVLEGKRSLDEAISQVQQASRNYAKRQLTWFRRNPAINWLRREKGQTTDEILTQARQVIAKNDK